MSNKMPNTPFSTRLSGSAKETELRIRNIYQWKKKRPPAVFVMVMALAVLLCFSLVSCQATESMEPIMIDGFSYVPLETTAKEHGYQVETSKTRVKTVDATGEKCKGIDYDYKLYRWTGSYVGGVCASDFGDDMVSFMSDQAFATFSTQAENKFILRDETVYVVQDFFEENDSGKLVFDPRKEIVGVTIETTIRMNKGEPTIVPVPEECLHEIVEWLHSFEIGEKTEQGTPFKPGTGSTSVLVEYANGTSLEQNISLITIDGEQHLIETPDAPQCWVDLVNGEYEAPMEPTDTTSTVIP